MAITTQELIDRIRRDFPTEPIPTDDQIRGESYAVNQYLKGKAWPEVTAKDIIEVNHDCPAAYLSFISKEAFRYYLPAYMLMNLLEWDEDTRWIYESVPFHLHIKRGKYTLRETDGSLVEIDEFPEKMDPFTPAQKRDIADFLQHQITHWGAEPSKWINEDAQAAFNAYWYQFASEPPE